MEKPHPLDLFLEFEKKNQLFDWQFDDVPVWEFIRWGIYAKLDPSYSTVQNDSSKKISKIFVGFKFFLLNFFVKNPFAVKNHVDTIFVNHSRRRFNTNSEVYDDIYTDLFLNDLPRISSYVVWENYFQWKHFKPVGTKNLFYLDRINFIYPILKKIKKYQFKKEEIIRIKFIETQLNDRFALNISNLQEIISEEIIAYKYIYKKLTKLFLKLKPQKIVVVVSYFGITQVACVLAKKMKIPVYELQHGTIGRYHMFYNYPEGADVKFFPDFFLSWGEFWTEKARFPRESKIILSGFPFFNHQRKLFESLERQKQILVISQLSKNIAYFALELSKIVPYKIIFKPHPLEYSEIDLKYGFLKNVNNIDILDDPKVNIYEYYNTSEYVLGVNSTTLIEALACESKIIIMKFPGWEYFEDLNEKNVFFAATVNDVIDILAYNKEDFFFDKDRFFVNKSNSEFVSLFLG